MPLIRKPDTQTLEDHLFGSGAFQFGWFATASEKFPATIYEYEDETSSIFSAEYELTEGMFVEGIKRYATDIPDRTFDDLIEDMDAYDVDAVIQIALFNEQRYS